MTKNRTLRTIARLERQFARGRALAEQQAALRAMFRPDPLALAVHRICREWARWAR